MQMMMLVFYDVGKLDAVIEAWAACEAAGVTVLEGAGARQQGRRGRRPDLARERCLTLFGLVLDKATACACIEATERVLGTLDEHRTGFMSSWDLSVLKGMGNPALRAWEEE
ncbi:MAG: hypothetical protein FJZ90_19350 [Chloroflexi bacterium]|nr:hypothetical protein [Chloroflexota bacterium]